MELSGSLEVSEVVDAKHTVLGSLERLLEGILEGVELVRLRDLDVFDDTVASVVRELGGVANDLEVKSIDHLDLEWLMTIELGHTADFSELNVRVVMVSMSLVFVTVDSEMALRGVLGVNHFIDVAHNEGSSSLAISVMNLEFIAEIDEEVSVETESLREDSSDVLGSELLVPSLDVFKVCEHLGKDYNVVVGEKS